MASSALTDKSSLMMPAMELTSEIVVDANAEKTESIDARKTFVCAPRPNKQESECTLRKGLEVGTSTMLTKVFCTTTHCSLPSSVVAADLELHIEEIDRKKVGGKAARCMLNEP